MGNCYDVCFKNSQLGSRDPNSLILSDSKIRQNEINQRCTRMLQTGFYKENTTFFVTTEPLLYFQCQYLIIFSDSLNKILRNPFFKQLGVTIRANLQNRLLFLKDKVQFDSSGHHINISQPFGNKIKISNLMIVWVQLFDMQPRNPNYQNKILKKSIQTALKQVHHTTTQNLSIGVIEIAHQLGYSLSQFRQAIKSNIQMMSENKKQIKMTYFANNNQNIQAFIDTVLGHRNDMTMTLTLAKSHASSSYF